MDAKHLHRQSTNLRYDAEQRRKYAEKLSTRAAEDLRHGSEESASTRQNDAMMEMQRAEEIERQAHEMEQQAADKEAEVKRIEDEMQRAKDDHEAKMRDLDKQRRSLLG